MWYVRIVTAVKGGAYRSDTDVSCESFDLAVSTCERFQREIGDDEPSRAYVLNEDRVPVWAAGGLGIPNPHGPSHTRGYLRRFA